MMFLAIHTTTPTRTAPSTLDTLVIDAPTWADAKAYALKHFAPTEWKNHDDATSGALGPGLIVKDTGEHAIADVELRHAGSAYGAKPNRHTELRVRTKKGWGEWKAA